MPSTRTEITVLLMIEAMDKAGDIVASIGSKLAAMGDAVKKAGGDAVLSGQELADAQLKAEAAGTAWRTSVDEQNAAMERLRITTEALKNAQVNQALVTDQDAKAAADAAKTVSVATTEQIAALDALKKAEDGVAERAAAMADAQKKASTESSATGIGLSQVGKVAAGTALAVAAIGYESIKAAANFQQATTVLVTSGGETAQNIDVVRQGILNLSESTGTATQQLVNGMYMIGSAGYTGAKGIDVLKAAAQGAKAENADLGVVSNALTTIMKDYGRGTDQATMSMNQLITAVQNGKTTTQDLAGSLANVLPLASAVHLGFDQVGGALATMTAQGMSAYQAAQDLNNSIRALSNPNNVAINEMQMLGINSTKLSEDLSKKGLTGTINELTDAIQSHFGPAGTVVISTFQNSATATQKVNEMMAGMPANLKALAQAFLDGSVSQKQWRADLLALAPEQDHMMTQFATLANKAHGFQTMLTSGSAAEQTAAAAMSKMMGGATGLNTALMLTANSGKDFQSNVDKIAASAKGAGSDVMGWSQIQGTFNQKLAELKQTVEVLAIRLGTALLPAVTTMLTWIMKIVQPIADWIGHNQKLAATLLVIIGIASTVITTFVVVMKVITMVKEAWAAFQAILAATEFNPVVLAITLLAVALYLIITHWSTVKKWILEFWDWLKTTAQEAWNFIKSHVDMVAGAVSVLLGPIGILIGLALEIMKHWDTLKKWFDEFWGGIKKGASDVADFFKGIWKDISKPLTDEWNHIVDDLTSIWESLTTIWNASGGKLVDYISEHLKAIEDAVRLFFNLVSGIFRAQMNFIVASLRSAWDVIRGGVQMAWDLIYGTIRAAWDLISGDVKAAVDGVASVLRATWDVILGIIKIAWETIKTVINTALDALKDIFKFFADLFTGQWGKLWGDVERVFKDAWNNTWSFLKSITATIGSTVSKAASDLWNGFIGAIEAAISGIWKALQDVWTSIQQFFSDAYHWLWDAGKAILTGFLDGVKSVWGDVTSFFGGVGNWIGNHKGPIEVDMVLLVPHGQAIMKGLLDGVQSQMPALQAKLGQVTHTVTASVNPTLSTVAAGASPVAPTRNQGNVQINFSFPNSNIAGPASVNWIMQQINRQFVQNAVPAAGIQIPTRSS